MKREPVKRYSQAFKRQVAREYNAIRPHDALGGLTPYAYAAAHDNRS